MNNSSLTPLDVKLGKDNLWTKDFLIICMANFFVALTFYLLMTTLALYAVEQFNTSQSKAGFASSIFVIGALFSRLLTGKYIEVIGRKRLLYSSLFLFFIATLLYFPVNNLGLLLVVRFLHGTAFGIAGTALSTAVMDLIPDERKGEGTGYFSLSVTAATALGPFLGLLITRHADFEMLFVVCAFFSALNTIVILFANIPEAYITEEQIQEMKKGFKIYDFFEERAVPVSIMMVLLGIAYSGVVTFFNTYAIELELKDAASFFFVVYALVLFVSRPLTGRLLDLRGDNIVIYPALITFSLSLLLLSQARIGSILLLAGALLALGFGTMMSCAQAIVVKESPKHRVGLATSTFFICMDGGTGIGPFLTGMLVPFVGFRGMYLTLAAVVLLSIILYYFVHGKNVALRRQYSRALNKT